jgi:DNA polymerase V
MKQKNTLVTTISPVATGKSDEHTLYGNQPAAGFPAPGDDVVEEPLDLNDLLIENPTATFFVRVSGDSMEGARIFDGDILVVDRSIQPDSGMIVVAAVYGELVVKRLKKTQSGLRLVSENELYEPIEISDNEGCFVWGVVTGLARVLS